MSEYRSRVPESILKNSIPYYPEHMAPGSDKSGSSEPRYRLMVDGVERRYEIYDTKASGGPFCTKEEASLNGNSGGLGGGANSDFFERLSAYRKRHPLTEEEKEKLEELKYVGAGTAYFEPP